MDLTLHIKMFGTFTISNDYYKFTPTNNRSLQVTRLITYLLANKEIPVSKDKLTDILWSESEDCQNPAGALRNLVYRARQVLADFYPAETLRPECILFTNNAYLWNPDVPCEIDIYQFEQYANLAKKESDPGAQFAYFEKMHDLYVGDFLSAQSSEEWVVFRSVYYKNLYTCCTVDMCRYLNSIGRYEDVIALCNASSIGDQLNEDLHKEKINAYLNSDAVSQALDYYYSVSDLFSQKYGVDLSSSMHDIYREIVKRLPNHQLNIAKLEENLRTKKDDNGTFYCNFDIFKNIYQINLRSVRRSQSKRYLTLFTLTDRNYPDIVTTDIKADMETLHQILAKNLRSNDVFTQSSPAQFSLILTVVNENGSRIAINRICDRYYQQHKHPNVEMEIESKLIQ
ncbi:AfsR/SARP family transcriptional regulator [Diplocloster modestus]|uniref:Bacterial transcriptional activator domain-containing protein n=1 Tax=Diplocloster modestus TaxID=2850322 RepID=A0ABS6K9S3_9FIRM|nr:BTAD domain-containing putative transcriptional regulator [Diplocloster modestus]MBU9727280.1 hypothetical protein [Diplocloster modestus]